VTHGEYASDHASGDAAAAFSAATQGAQRAAVFAAAAAALPDEEDPQGGDEGDSLEAELTAAAASRPKSLFDELGSKSGGGMGGEGGDDAHSEDTITRELRALAALDVTALILALDQVPTMAHGISPASAAAVGAARDGQPEREASTADIVQGAAPETVTDVAAGAGGVDPGEDSPEDRLRAALHARLFDGQGEALLELGPVDPGQADGFLARLSDVATSSLGASCQLIHQRASATRGDSRIRLDVLVRLPPSDDRHLNLRCAVIGNVDAGKSTLVGVLVGGALDNGRGSARLKVLKHKHEAESGRTSSISEDQHLGFDEHGKVMNAQAVTNPVLPAGADGAAQPASAAAAAGTEGGKGVPRAGSNWQEVVQRSSKVVSFIDLAGHEKYLKTTMFGLTAHDPDYALVVVGANHGVTRMTREHLGVAIALAVPVFVVVTKEDLAPGNILKETLAQLMRLLKLPGARKKPFLVRGMDDVVVASRVFREGFVAPIFTVSNVSGLHMDLVHAFVNLLPSRKLWSVRGAGSVEFLVDQFFNVPGIGTVVAGTLVSGCVQTAQTLQLGPDSAGVFHPVVVKSIHHMRVPTQRLLTGQSGAFLMRALKRKEHVRSLGLRKGMVLLDAGATPTATWRFRCDVLVLHSSTTMRCNYQPVLHVRNVRQSARITRMDREVLRTGTKAAVDFEFLFRPEYVVVGSRLIFREGKTKGIGNITHIFPPTAAPS